MIYRIRVFMAAVVLVSSYLASSFDNDALGGTPPVMKCVNTSSSTALQSGSGGYIRCKDKPRVVVFVNGIFGDATSTWTNSDGAYWPAMIAADPDFNDVDIYVHSFQSPKLAVAQDIGVLAARLKDLLVQDHVWDHKEAVFLTHSMGGLVTRALLVDARISAKQVPMIYFFATPTAGAAVTEIAVHLSENPQLKDMLPLADGGYIKGLREQWLETAADPNLNYPSSVASFCAYELRKTWHVLIVPELSATYLCNRETRSVNADHTDIVKPKDARDDPYVFFKAAYIQTFGPTAQLIATALDKQTALPLGVVTKTIPLQTVGPKTLSLIQTKGTSQYVDVGCEETKEGEIAVGADLKEFDHIIDVRPAIVNTVNVKSSAASLIRIENSRAVVRYSIRGLDRQFFNCPGGGHADVLVNFIVSHDPPPKQCAGEKTLTFVPKDPGVMQTTRDGRRIDLGDGGGGTRLEKWRFAWRAPAKVTSVHCSVQRNEHVLAENMNDSDAECIGSINGGDDAMTMHVAWQGTCN